MLSPTPSPSPATVHTALEKVFLIQELADEIASYLTSLQICSMLLSSRLFRCVALPTPLLHLDASGQNPTAPSERLLEHHGTLVRSLTLKHPWQPPSWPDIETFLLERVPNVQKLTVLSRHYDMNRILDWIQRLPKLRSLHVFVFHAYKRPRANLNQFLLRLARIDNLTNLKELTISKADHEWPMGFLENFSWQTVIKVLRACPSLEKLDLRMDLEDFEDYEGDEDYIREHGPQEVEEPTVFPNITELYFEGYTTDDVRKAFVQAFPNLRTLKLRTLDFIWDPDLGIEPLDMFPKLTELHLGFRDTRESMMCRMWLLERARAGISGSRERQRQHLQQQQEQLESTSTVSPPSTATGASASQTFWDPPSTTLSFITPNKEPSIPTLNLHLAGPSSVMPICNDMAHILLESIKAMLHTRTQGGGGTRSTFTSIPLQMRVVGLDTTNDQDPNVINVMDLASCSSVKSLKLQNLWRLLHKVIIVPLVNDVELDESTKDIVEERTANITEEQVSESEENMENQMVATTTDTRQQPPKRRYSTNPSTWTMRSSFMWSHVLTELWFTHDSTCEEIGYIQWAPRLSILLKSLPRLLNLTIENSILDLSIFKGVGGYHPDVDAVVDLQGDPVILHDQENWKEERPFLEKLRLSTALEETDLVPNWKTTLRHKFRFLRELSFSLRPTRPSLHGSRRVPIHEGDGYEEQEETAVEA
ncbi:hypothetical protein BGZ83_003810 [Gryganskiella cystojenkinii]|nr:hypothetical protein BGZ83_003810 [Gryganskiella cystojenkinii]